MVSKPTRVLVIRHGEAQGNLERTFQGHTDAPISENGRKQLELLSVRCRNMSIDAIYTSPLIRAQETAEAVNQFHKVPIRVREDLMEIHGGVWEGEKWAELPDRFPQEALAWSLQPHTFAPRGGEPMRRVYERMRCAVLGIAEEHLGGQVCVVSHGCAIRNLLCWAMGYPIERLQQVDWCDNTGLTLLELDGQLRPRVLYANDASHLDEETSTFSKQAWWRPENRDKLCFKEEV